MVLMMEEGSRRVAGLGLKELLVWRCLRERAHTGAWLMPKRINQ